MRLINTKSLEIQEFGPLNTPKYAILSHTWGEDEATFAQWCSRLARLRKGRRSGFTKIHATCRQARRDGLSYVWIDTVCIDKTSSAELSEAINSMFDWYERAEICYVYLADIPSEPPAGVDLLELMGSSRWFSRGWTLQELIAPENVVFYSQSWRSLGTKKALARFISDVTGIDQICIRNRAEKPLRKYSIAQRMSWAADRATTRPEDMAYCLLGLFGINIPLLYGEGRRAFIRLQEEIIRTSDDHSVLAFDTALSHNSLLADHPDIFRGMGNLHPSLSSRITPPFAITNAGLSIKTPLIQTLSPHWVLAVLNCVEIGPWPGARKNNKATTQNRCQICLPLLGKDGVYMRAREPICIIRRNLSEVMVSNSSSGHGRGSDDSSKSSSKRDSSSGSSSSRRRRRRCHRCPHLSRHDHDHDHERHRLLFPDVRVQIENLTTTEETSYLISHFTRVYPAFAYEIDLALKGFDEDIMPGSGFMLTFPRGMLGYRLVTARPAEALQRKTSFFNPPVMDNTYGTSTRDNSRRGSSSNGDNDEDDDDDDDDACTITSPFRFAHGLLVFEDATTKLRIGVYLAQNLDTAGSNGGHWMCVLAPLPDSDHNHNKDIKDGDEEKDMDIYDRCMQSWQFEEDPERWVHYDQMGEYIVAARTTFTLKDPVRQVVMVEVVFDAYALMREQGLDMSSVKNDSLELKQNGHI